MVLNVIGQGVQTGVKPVNGMEPGIFPYLEVKTVKKSTKEGRPCTVWGEID